MTRKRAPNGEPLKFINDALATDHDQCILWPYAVDSQGYARTKIKGYTSPLVHKIVCEIAHGKPLNDKLEAAHSCGNGKISCINPNHISWKTSKENHADKIIHGTCNRGERHGHSKLTSEDVLQIRRLQYNNTHKQLAGMFGVSSNAIYGVLSGRNWGWLASKEG